MEVHHHSHTDRKKWTHYFWEFLMLFLAVFCGFLAENFREHVVEHKREKQYIVSYIEDLKSDTTAISQNIERKSESRRNNDSLIWYLNTPDPNQYGQRIYFLARKMTRTSFFIPADRTVKQLKNSGNLRLIRKQQASDSILAYDQAVDRILSSQNIQNDEVVDIRHLMGRLMNPNILETMISGQTILPPTGNPRLRTSDREFLLDFIYAVHQLKSSDILNGYRLQSLKARATTIIVFLKDIYHLRN